MKNELFGVHLDATLEKIQKSNFYFIFYSQSIMLAVSGWAAIKCEIKDRYLLVLTSIDVQCANVCVRHLCVCLQ